MGQKLPSSWIQLSKNIFIFDPQKVKTTQHYNPRGWACPFLTQPWVENNPAFFKSVVYPLRNIKIDINVHTKIERYMKT